jgi:similar to stage IV sporulation protein
MLVNSLFIWKISVEGNYSYSDSQIINFIHKQKIKEGILRTEIDSDKIEKDIRKNFEDISWVCAEIKGTNLIIHIKENYITEISAIEDEPYDIVANRDATIVSVLVRSGSAMVKVGDTVKKGDVLISGVVDVVDESEQKLFSKFCNADGDIVGETVYDYNDSLKINYTKKTTKKTRTIYLPSVLNYRWMKVGEKNKSDIIYSEKSLKMFGNFYLPLSIQKYTIISYTNQPAIYSKEEGWQILNNKLLYKLTVMEQKGYKILKKDVKINKEKDSYVLSGRIVCQELLGTVSYIDMNQYSNQSEEGTTEINERN